MYTTHFGIKAVVEQVPAHISEMFRGARWPEAAPRPLIFIPGTFGTGLMLIPAEEV
jgi:hypothetical protein